MGKDLRGVNIGTGYSQRPDGRYHARATVNGIKIEIYNKSLSQLKKEFELAKADALKEEHNVDKNLKLSEWVDSWFNTHKAPRLKSETSKATYYRRIKNTYCKLLGDKKISSITHMNIQDATNELIDSGYRSRTVKEALGILRECLDIATINRIIQINPCVKINMPDANEAMKERRVLDNWEQELFLQEIKNDYYEEAYKILLLTGMRIGEFSGLHWEDIDHNNKIIKIQRSMTVGYVNGKKIEMLTSPKTSTSYRDIPFIGDVGQLFKSWKKKQDEYKEKLGERWRARAELGNLVFTNSLGAPVTRYVLVHSIEKIETNMRLKEAFRASREGREQREIKHIHPHAFRHTFATRCFERGVDPLVIQSIMGHSNFATTLVYTHVLNDKKQKEISKMNNFFE
jgi:integrase